MNDLLIAFIKSVLVVIFAIVVVYVGLSFFLGMLTGMPEIGYGFAIPAIALPFIIYLFVPGALLFGTVFAADAVVSRGYSLLWLPLFIVPVVGPLTFYYYKGKPVTSPRKTNSVIRILYMTVMIACAAPPNVVAYFQFGRLVNLMGVSPLSLMAVPSKESSTNKGVRKQK